MALTAISLSTGLANAAPPDGAHPDSAAATIAIVGTWNCTLAQDGEASPKLVYEFEDDGTGRMTFELNRKNETNDQLVLKYHAETIYALSAVVNAYSERITKVGIDEYTLNGAPLPSSQLDLAQAYIEQSVVGGMGLFIAAPQEDVVQIGRGDEAMLCDRVAEG